MNQSIDNKDEESVRHAQRAARIEQMRREKQLQEERREKIKKIFPMVAGIAGVVVVFAIAGSLLVGSCAKENDTKKDTQGQLQLQTDENMPDTDLDGIQSGVENGTLDSGEIQWKLVNAASTELPGLSAALASAQQKMQDMGISVNAAGVASYVFNETADTATIYSENVISPNAILINESTDTIVASKGAKQRICPASMTKVLTVLVAAEHIDMNKLDDTITMTKEITDYAYVNDCSTVGFLDGEKVTIRDLFYGTIMPSGGDAAVGLATYVAGSHEAFVDMMNAKVKELGISESAHFTNCVGLYDDNLYCTVYDMAVIMKAALQNEFLKEVLSAKKYTTTPTTEHPEGISISNWFLRRIEDKDTGGEVLCAKTGYVNESGNCAVSYGTSADGVPYICVTAGATSSWRCIYDHVEIYNRYVESK